MNIHEFKDGFLSKEIRFATSAIEERYKDWLDLFALVNQCAVLTQHEININEDNQKQRYAAVYFARTITSSQAAIAILLRGLPSQAECLLRMSLEALFVLGALSRNAEAAVQKLNQSHASEKQKFSTKIQLWLKTGEHKIDPDAINNLDLSDQSKEKIERVYISSLAKLGGYDGWYENTYMQLSWSAHNAINDLEKHLVTNENGEIIAFKNEPQIEDLDFAFCCSIQILINSLNELFQIFVIESSTEIKEFSDKFESLRKLHNL